MKLNRKNFAELFRTDYNIVSVVFAESELNRGPSVRGRLPDGAIKLYDYKIPKDWTISIGDKLLVCTDNNLDYLQGLKVVKVVKLNSEPEIEEDSPFDYKWIVAKVDDVMEKYIALIEQDTNLKRAVSKLEQALERVSLRKQLETAMSELDDGTRSDLARLFNMPNLLGNDGAKENKEP